MREKERQDLIHLLWDDLYLEKMIIVLKVEA